MPERVEACLIGKQLGKDALAEIDTETGECLRCAIGELAHCAGVPDERLIAIEQARMDSKYTEIVEEDEYYDDEVRQLEPQEVYFKELGDILQYYGIEDVGIIEAIFTANDSTLGDVRAYKVIEYVRKLAAQGY